MCFDSLTHGYIQAIQNEKQVCIFYQKRTIYQNKLYLFVVIFLEIGRQCKDSRKGETLSYLDYWKTRRAALFLILVSMNLTLMQGHSGSAKAKNQRWIISTTKQAR